MPPKPVCRHDGGSRDSETGEWVCSTEWCGKRWPSYEAWGTDTDNEDAVAAVKGAIEADLAAMSERGEI